MASAVLKEVTLGQLSMKMIRSIGMISTLEEVRVTSDGLRTITTKATEGNRKCSSPEAKQEPGSQEVMGGLDK